MKILVEKSRFLRLAYQAQARGATNHSRLEEVEAKVPCLHGELEAS